MRCGKEGRKGLPQDLRLGIDVGGTNTDAVALDDRGHVLAKTPTTPDVTTGIVEARLG